MNVHGLLTDVHALQRLVEPTSVHGKWLEVLFSKVIEVNLLHFCDTEVIELGECLCLRPVLT